jgi:exonuclease VII small subunit
MFSQQSIVRDTQHKAAVKAFEEGVHLIEVAKTTLNV